MFPVEPSNTDAVDPMVETTSRGPMPSTSASTSAALPSEHPPNGGNCQSSFGAAAPAVKEYTTPGLVPENRAAPALPNDELGQAVSVQVADAHAGDGPHFALGFDPLSFSGRSCEDVHLVARASHDLRPAGPSRSVIAIRVVTPIGSVCQTTVPSGWDTVTRPAVT